VNLILSIVVAGHLLFVVPHPSPDYVSTAADTVTRSRWAAVFGAIGLLAHNNIAGRYFGDLELGDAITVTSATTTREYEVVEIKRYRIDADMFIDLDTETKAGNGALMDEVYRPGYVVLQTCIKKGSDPTWGRVFVLAKEKEGE
jgi:sortase (surface protein transpeptidase)